MRNNVNEKKDKSDHWISDVVVGNFNNNDANAQQILAIIGCKEKGDDWYWYYMSYMGYETAKAMFADIEKAYQLCSDTIGADGIIPCGKLMMTLLDKGIEKVHRDTFHASLGLGRFAQGLLWYKVLTGNSVADITYNDFDEEIPAEQIAIAKEVVDSLMI